MNKDEIRIKFEEFSGTERYLRFLDTVQEDALRNARLKYKQEIEWSQLAEKYNLTITEIEDICSYFQYCYIHKVDFEKDVVKIKYGTRVPPSGEKLEKIMKLYPHANLIAYGPCWAEDAKTKQVSFCPKCREAYLRENESGA